MHPVSRSPIISSANPRISSVDLELEENEDDILTPSYENQTPSSSKALGKLPEVKLEPDLTSPALLAVLTNLQTQLAILIEENQRQRMRIQELESRPIQHLSPGEFHGKVSEYRNFIAQCSVTFVMCPHTYNTDERKVLFIVSLLRGSAMTWAREILDDETHPLRNDYPAFKLALDNLYLDRNYKSLCEDKLCELRQEKSVAHYATEFKSLVSPLGFNDPAKRCMFYRGLSSTVKTGLVTMGRASDFEALADQAIALDQRQFQARREEKKSSNSAKPRPQQQSGKPSTSYPQQPRPQINVTPVAGPHTSYHRPPISDGEKERRRVNNLCMYCGEPKHRAENCPNRKTHSATSIAPYPHTPEKGQSQGPQR